MVVFFVLIFLSLAHSSSGTFGTVTNFYPKTTHPDGSVEVVIRMKVNSLDCGLGQWQCFSGDCGNETSAVTGKVYEDDEGYCQMEQILTRRVPTNGPFEIRSNIGESGEEDITGVRDQWRNLTVVDLRTRSDSGKSNSSPQTSTLPIVRVPVNCPRKYEPLRFDPDGDEVFCKYLTISHIRCTECVSAALLPSFLPEEPCTIVYTPNLSQVGDTSRVDQVMEDFPRNNLTLVDSNGSRETPSESLSKVSVQFIFKVGSSVPSCEEGLYLPKFLPPTPDHGAQVYAAPHQQIGIIIRFAANFSASSRLFHNGPFNVTQVRTGLKEFALLWTPTDEHRGLHFPLCFVLQVTTMFGDHESEPRCVVVTVVKVPEFQRPTPDNGTELFVSVNQSVAIFIQVDTPTPDHGLLFSGPQTMRNSTIGPGSFLLFWTPSDADEGRSFIISFYVIFSNMIFSQYPLFNYYQSELRTITVTVRNETVKAAPVNSAFLRTKIISATPLSEDFLQNQVLQELKEELANLGVTPNIKLRLVSSRKTSVEKKPPK